MPHRHRHHHHGHHHHNGHRQHLTYLELILSVSLSSGSNIDTFKVATFSKDCLIMDTQVSMGHVINAQLVFLDQNGNPMLIDPKPDSAPAWTNMAPTVETLIASVDGLQATITPVAVGVDTVNVTLSVAGVKFNANLNVVVAAAPQVLTSVAVTATVV